MDSLCVFNRLFVINEKCYIHSNWAGVGKCDNRKQFSWQSPNVKQIFARQSINNYFFYGFRPF